jgi:muramoyltetrapeptide carboxypeptidase
MLQAPVLEKGQKIAITASSSTVAFKDLEYGIKVLKDWGLVPVLGKTLGTHFHNFSAKDAVRKTELQAFIDDPEIKAVMFARGGYGLSRILDDLDFSVLFEKPKWFIGFSDLTALHLHLNRMGIMSIHGPMCKTLSFDSQSNANLFELLFNSNPNTPYFFSSKVKNRAGTVEGRAIGGNLCLICHCLGTASEPDFTNAILFMEDIGEYAYAIDRYLVQLKRAGVFKKIKGIVVGNFSDTKETKVPFGISIEDCIKGHSHEENIPIAFGFAFGHEKVNYPIIMGAKYQLNVEKNKATLSLA